MMDNQHPSNSSFPQTSRDHLPLPPAQVGVPRLAYVYQQPQQGSAGGGMIVMPVATYQYKPPPNYDYRPSNFLALSVMTVLLCGIFSPPTLALSIPALFFSIKSSNSANAKAIRQARTQGMIAAYLNFTAIIIALVAASLLVGLIVGIEGNQYSLQLCINRVTERNGGVFPTLPTSTSSGSNFFNQRLRC